MSRNTEQAWAERLAQLGLAIQNHVASILREAFSTGANSLARSVAEEGGDRIYAIDRAVEPLIEQEIATWSEDCFPLMLISEGLGEHGRRIFGPPGQPLRFRVIVDPIDGTRMLMYDKRSAWFLAAVAEDRGETTSLADSFASVLVELPTSRQNLADLFLATRVDPTRGFRIEVGADAASPAWGEEFLVQPSLSEDLSDGFVTVCSFFPGTRLLAAELAERIAEETGMLTPVPEIFDDQYMSTGGQMVQLMTGRDRCVIDLRPDLNNRLGLRGDDRFIESHPYDLAGLLAAQQAGVTVTDATGRQIDAPLDVTTGISWCGYANEALQGLIEPVVQKFLGHG